MKHTSPENAADLQRLKQLIAVIPIGSMLTYTELATALGRDAREKWWLVTRAIQECEEETGGLFAVVRGEGIKRLQSASIPDVGLAAIQKIRRTAKRGSARLEAVRINDLQQSEQHRLIAHRAQLGAIALIADGRKTVTLVRESASSDGPLKIGRVLELLTPKK